MKTKSKAITIHVPWELLKRMSDFRKNEGVSVTHQLCAGAEMYLKKKRGLFG